MLDILSFINNYGDLIVAAVLLAGAFAVVPGRARWYILTAGVGMLVFAGYQRVTNRKLLAEADRGREALRGKAKELDQRHKELETVVSKLSGELQENKTRQAELDKERAALAQRGDALSASKQALDAQHDQLTAENAALLDSLDHHESTRSTLREALHALDRYERSQRVAAPVPASL